MKKGFKRLGMLVSVAVVIVGICVLCGAIYGNPSYSTDAPTGYDSGYAIFGADFYSYVCNNSAEAASAARAAANNVIDVVDSVNNIGGIILIAMGLFGFCFFGMMPTGAFKVELPVSAVPVSAPAAEPVSAAVACADVSEPAAAEAPTPLCESETEEKNEIEKLLDEELNA